MSIGFGSTGKNPGVFEELCLGKIVEVYTQSNFSFTGRFAYVEDGYAVIKPVQRNEWEEGKIKIVLTDEACPIRLDAIISMKPLSERSVVDYIEDSNRETQKSKEAFERIPFSGL